MEGISVVFFLCTLRVTVFDRALFFTENSYDGNVVLASRVSALCSPRIAVSKGASHLFFGNLLADPYRDMDVVMLKKQHNGEWNRYLVSSFSVLSVLLCLIECHSLRKILMIIF